MDTRQSRVLLEGGAHARYVSTGHLVFARGGGLVMVPFDLSRLEITGRPVPVLDGVMTNSQTGVTHYGISTSGSLVYLPGGHKAPQQELLWVDHKGKARLVTEARRAFLYPSISPDGSRVAVSISDNTGRHIWIYDTRRDRLERLTLEGRFNGSAIWTSDGKRLAFRSNRYGPTNILWKSTDGSGFEERLTQSPNAQYPSAWSPDGKWLLYEEVDKTTGFDIWTLPMEDRKPRPVLRSRFSERHASLSHDGHWLAYASDESGPFEVYVKPFSPEANGPGGRWQVSTEGGVEPIWAKKGKELFYRNGNRMMAVEIAGPPFVAGKPRLLFEGNYSQTGATRNYDITADDAEFLMMRLSDAEASPKEFRVVLNWFEELKTRVSGAPK